MRGSSRSIAALVVAGVLLAASARRAAADAGGGGAGAPDGGPERITSFDSDVVVAEDGALHVRETVRVRSAGVVFKHGLERRFPVRYTGPLGGRMEVGFQVEGALRDGAPAPFTVRRAGRDMVIRIGAPSVLLEPGQHVFELTYVTTRQLGFFRDHDEIYWNAVGTEWRVPIDAATATVTLPPAARGLARAPVAYVGPAGSRERADRADLRPMGATFAAGRPLGAGEGMTIVVEWPKGVVAAPSSGTRVSWWLHDNPESVIALLGIAALMVLVRVARARLAGPRAPGGGARGPARTAADGRPLPAVSPALLRYIVRRGYDARSLPVAIMDMAERGCVTVHQGAHFALERTDKTLDLLPSEEQSAARTLFDGRQRVELAPSDRQWLGAASAALKWDLDQRGESYITDGHGPAILGLGLALAIIMAALGAATRDGFLAVLVGGWFGAWSIALCALAAFVGSLVMGWMGRSLVGGARADTNATTAGIAVVFTLGVAAMVLAIAQYLATHELSPLGAVLLFAVAFCGHRALRLWRVRTAAGEELFAQARDLTRSLGGDAGAGVGRLLAYALALDAVAAWEASLSKLAGDGSGGDPTGGFHWLYRDRDWERNHLRTGWPLASFADGFSSAVTASTGPAPGTSPGGASGGSSGGWSDSSSSSSSDSGGSSGGGGGGGGGGGW